MPVGTVGPWDFEPLPRAVPGGEGAGAVGDGWSAGGVVEGYWGTMGSPVPWSVDRECVVVVVGRPPVDRVVDGST